MSTRAPKYDPLAYVRTYYGVPAYKGKRVRYTDYTGVIKDGTITRGVNQYIDILFDGDKKPRGPFHPTDGIEYLPE